MKSLWKAAVGLGIGAMLLIPMLLVRAQEFPGAKGSNTKQGRQIGSVTSHTPGRMFLRWWDPILSIDESVDNWEPTTFAFPASAWEAPTGIEASGAEEKDPQPGHPPYYYCDALQPAAAFDTPTLLPGGQRARTFSWTFTGVKPNEQYALYVNLPVGPTDVDPSGIFPNLFYPQQFYVYEIIGVENPDNPGQPIVEVIDTYAVGGGQVRFGNSGRDTDKLYVSDGTGSITIKLYNTIPLDNLGQPTDTRPNILVYADSALAVRAFGTLGEISASPIIGQLKTDPGDTQAPGLPLSPWRVWVPRNEPMSLQVGSEVFSYNTGLLTAFRHNGTKVDQTEPGLGGDVRRNMIWSWPAKRPFANTAAEIDGFANAKRNWILGLNSAGPSRAFQTIQQDNMNAYVSVGSGWTSQITIPGYKGDNYLEKDADVNLAVPTPPASTKVMFRPILPDGDYDIYVWTAGNPGLVTGARYEIFQGGARVGIATVNQAASAGWVQLRVNNTTRFSSTFGLPLGVAVTDQSVEPTDVGKKVSADMVRFVRQSDLRMVSTPVFATANINIGGTLVEKDVVVVACENGRLYCMDAKGNFSGGEPTGETTVYWAYPSELPTGVADPNHNGAMDGPDGIAEMPVGFDTNSAVVSQIRIAPGPAGLKDYLFIGSTNGRVYCIDMAGRGDGVSGSHYGTTNRVWTYPNDYPSPSVQSTLGPLVGSMALANSNNRLGANRPTLFVPSTSGRFYALDAAGDAATKTTQIAWQYPSAGSPNIGSIRMTPAVLGNQVFFGTGGGGRSGNNTFFAISTNDADADGTGNLSWQSTGTPGLPFGPFDRSGPSAITSSDIGGGAPDTVFVPNIGVSSTGAIYALRAADGAEVWTNTELGSDASGSLVFSYMTSYQPSGALDPLPGKPVVFVPLRDGRYVALYARVDDVTIASTGPNNRGRRQAWGYQLDGLNPVAPATGARIPTGLFATNEQHCWMVGGDDKGQVYAFSYDPRFPDNDQTLTPGTPPGQQQITENNPTFANLRDLVSRAKVRYILPRDYDTLNQKRRLGTLTYADIVAVSNQVTRVRYEFGESLYILVYDMPQPDFYDPALNYTLEMQFNAPGSTSQRRPLTPLPLTGTTPDRSRYALTAFTIQPVGTNALTPGAATVQVRAIAQRGGSPGQQGATGNLNIGTANFSPSDKINLANPLALSLGANAGAIPAANKIGWTTSPDDPETFANGNLVGGNIKFLNQGFGPDLNNLGDPISHGQTSVSGVWVWDRSLMRLVLGDGRGLQNIRFQATTLNFILAGQAPQNVVFKQLNPTVYPDYEEMPGAEGTNISLDYPDIRRDALAVTKQIYGDVENPLFQPVGLVPPIYTNTDFTNYRSDPAVYNAFLNRQLQPTQFDMALDVPKYQPPGRNGYSGEQIVYVDSGQAGRQFSGPTALEAFRAFNSTANVAIDERIGIGTPTVDLGSVPGGAGFSPASPWNDASFRLDSPLFNVTGFPFFQRFAAFNEGNVNLLNVRMAKSVSTDPFFSKLVAPTLHEAAWLDAPLHLHSDLDPRFVPAQVGGQVIFQKPRVGDGLPARLRVNPVRRQNGNLGVTEAPLFNTALFPLLDPKVGVSAPIGTPVGGYTQQIFIFEDRESPSANAPVMGPDQDPLFNPGLNANVFEPYSEPGITLKFNVRETRLTNRQTTKATTMVDELGLVGNETFTWGNQEPAAARDGNGNLYVIWSSNRLDNSGQPSWLPKPKTEGDTVSSDGHRLYLGVLRDQNAGTAPGSSPIRDLNSFVPATNSRWFQQEIGPFPGGSMTALFGIGAGETLDQSTIRFGKPSMPSDGFFDAIIPGSSGIGARDNTYVAFIGEAIKRDAQGTQRRISRLFLSQLRVQASGQATLSNPIPLEYTLNGQPLSLDPSLRLGKPSITQFGDNAVVFFTSTSGGLSQINWAIFDGTNWIKTNFNNYIESLQLSNAFEAVGSVSAVFRTRFVPSGGNSSRVPCFELVFNGKLRGKATSEVFWGRLNANAAGYPTRQGGTYTIPWPVRFDPLTQDTASAVYWSMGSEWRSNNSDTSVFTQDDPTATPYAQPYIDIKQQLPVGNGFEYRSILDQSTRSYDADARAITANTIFGGKAVIDMATGAIRFTGALMPRNVRLFARYSPRFMRISAGGSANYRGATMTYDQRFTGESAYWATSNNTGATPTALTRNDRFITTYVRTSIDGTSQSRPAMRSYRFGVQLPTAIQTESNGNITFIQVASPAGPNTGMIGGSFYQVDAVSGKVYFTAENEGRTVTIRYRGVDENGRPFSNRIDYTGVVGIINEAMEQTVPIEQVANESGLSVALDPLNSTFNSQSVRRPGLLWLFWTSTRAGTPDIYFQTIAPKYNSKSPTN